ncbi:putative ADE1-phosphoribosylamidoimidazole-succinocarboxamide synthase [Meira miltonrushii]|uniref:Phosphoribosylaminoimidazole-succinocarboxamide synthase n=1 Tax=Meira miltonrushii TaxID=1280837 RepID=A0A316VIK8_9BASI|nr:putative ADE1-phosphoribosylamidoimidazole-succinocarboxamide synthase [Meira miltonrushii]PWN37469.1 putative ADE1-phosphoribosylamidoimidazole-succinocarboxamide synthase [Meira miltonrushii]
MSSALTTTSLPLPLIAKGKVRDVYDAGQGTLLFVATDRISAFDIVLENGIPGKGKLLHALSTFWFKLLTPHLIGSHVLADSFDDFPAELKEKLAGVKDQVENRSMLVKRADVVPVEAIVRGYLTGSGWKEYKQHGTVHGIRLAEGIVESQEIPNGPIFTPSTKAEQGAHDENIHPDKVKDIVGAQRAEEISKAAIQLYTKASQHARSRGIILADTKFEFGLIPPSSSDRQTLILVDEVLTPDSSRFWDANAYKAGESQSSFDKQYVRDWLKSKGLDKAADEGTKVSLPSDVVQRTAEKYREAYERITGEKWNLQ